MSLAEAVFIDVEATRRGRLLAIAAICGERVLRLDPRADGAADQLERFIESRCIAGHNVAAFDLPHLEAALGFRAGARTVVDTLVLSLLATPDRPSHALPKAAPDRTPDPVADARASRAVATEASEALRAMDPGLAGLYGALLARAGHAGLPRTLGWEAKGLAEALAGTPETFLDRFCRVRLEQLVQDEPEDDRWLALALALRWVEVAARDGRVTGPPSPAMSALPGFGQALTRLMGPICPDRGCDHRLRCDVHRPFVEELLARHFELPGFRPHQEEVIHAVLGGDNPVAILPTGGGKSLCYQLPAVHGGDRLHGLTVVISPLQALMADQVRALSARYPPTCFINSTLLLEERRRFMAGLYSGLYHVLYMGPEQLRNPSMVRLLRSRPPFLWVIDEAHCISQWGHGFRTDYTYVPRAIRAIHGEGRPPLVSLFTATATVGVKADLGTLLEAGLGVRLREMDFGRPRTNLRYRVSPCADAEVKRVQLLDALAAHTGSGARLVYCATVRAAREVAALLREADIPCALYHGRLSASDKVDQLERFLGGRVATVVATSAFGMGIDKPDIRLVVHFELPGSLEDYVQETGRAGRDGAPSDCVLLFSEEDLETQFYLKTAGRVTARDVRYVFRGLTTRARQLRRHADADGWVPLWVNAEDLFVEEQLEAELDWDRDMLQGKLKLVLYHLEADGALERLENRTRAFGIVPTKETLAEAEAALPADTSPPLRRVLRYLYDPDRPRRLSVLDIAEATDLRPAEAFRHVQRLASRGLVGQELSFEVTLSRGVRRATRDVALHRLAIAEGIFERAEDPDDDPILQLRHMAGALAHDLGRRVLPHEVFDVLRALRRLDVLRLDKWGAGRYRVRFTPTFLAAREALARACRTAEALLRYADERLSGRQGRDLVLELDVNRFLAAERRLTEVFTPEGVVDACLLLHHLDAWHLADPPVLLETAMRVRVDPRARSTDLDTGRPARYHRHQVALVHFLREYAVLPAERRDAYLADYFALPREELVDRYFDGRRRAIQVPVGPRTEAAILDGLTPAQRDAVAARDRALLVVAGPGSGKTHTVVRRIAHMVRARQIRPGEILVLAFNRSAAAELRGRLERTLGARGRYVDVRTFHSLALRITGLDPSDIAAGDTSALLDRAMAEASEVLRPPEGASPATAEAIRRRALGGVRHVLVDEYQDLDGHQYELLTALVALDRASQSRTERSIYVVGDDDQAVYGFRNASVEFLRRFEAEFGARRICLSENYRSDAALIRATAAFIASNPDRMKLRPEEQMRPATSTAEGAADAVQRFLYADQPGLAAHAAYSVQRSLEEGSETVAVLARHWSDLDPVRFFLERAGVPIVVHHRGLRRPLHRRHPIFRVLRTLLDVEAPRIEGPAVEHVRAIVTGWGHAPEEPAVAELLALLDDVDDTRRLGPTRTLCAITAGELAQHVLLASREASRQPHPLGPPVAVHLCTFHSAKGLEFDKVIVLPSRPRPGPGLAEERRAYYVAMTRARHHLVLATLGAPGELALQVACPDVDLRPLAGHRHLQPAHVGYLDCDPSDVHLGSRDVLRAQRALHALREGERLHLVHQDGRVCFRRGDHVVAELSAGGRERLRQLHERYPGQVEARVHEVYVHLDRAADGAITGSRLTALPTVIAGRLGA